MAAAVALPWWLAAQGGPQALAAYAGVLAITTLFVVPVMSPFGDRWCKARQIVAGLAAMAIVLGALGLCARMALNPPLLMVLLMGKVGAMAIIDPARSAFIAELVPAEHLPRAIRLQKIWRAAGAVLGPACAGLALPALGAGGVLIASALLLAGACAVSLGLPRRSAPAPFKALHWWRELKRGACIKWRLPMERGWTAVNFLVWIFQGPAVGILVPMKVQAMGVESHWLGWGLAGLAVGSLCGSAFGSENLVHRFGRFRVRVAWGCFEGLCLMVVGLAHHGMVLVAALVLAGFCNAAMGLVGATHRALAIPRDYRVRLLAAGSVSTQVAGAIGAALVGAGVTQFSVSGVYAAFGLLMAASVLGLLAVPRLREFFALDHRQVTDWYALQYPLLFERPAESVKAPA